MPIVAIEGIDCAAKQTQAKKLRGKLAELILNGELNGRTILLQDFPDYSTETGKAVLSLLKEEWRPVFNIDDLGVPVDPTLKPMLIQTLMTINRHEKYDLLREYKESPSKFLILDRYFASGLAYGEADGLSPDYLAQIHRGLPSADLWILLDITPEESVRRRPIRRDEYETRTGFLGKVRDNYHRIFADPKFEGLWTVVDGMQSEGAVHEQITTTIKQLFIGEDAA